MTGALTVSLSHAPFWPYLVHVEDCLLPQWRRAREDDPDAIEIVLLALFRHPGHANHNWRYLTVGKSQWTDEICMWGNFLSSPTKNR